MRGDESDVAQFLVATPRRQTGETKVSVEKLDKMMAKSNFSMCAFLGYRYDPDYHTVLVSFGIVMWGQF